MKNLFKIFLCSFLLVWATSATAEIKYGIGISAGQVETSGTETEGTAADALIDLKLLRKYLEQQTFLLSLYQIASNIWYILYTF